MEDTEKRVLDIIRKVWPTMTDVEKARLAGWGEGLSYKTEYIRDQEAIQQQATDKGA